MARVAWRVWGGLLAAGLLGAPAVDAQRPVADSSGRPAEAAARVRRRPDLISAEEIALLPKNVQTAAEAVQVLRPQMLRPRGGGVAPASGGGMADAGGTSGVAVLYVYQDGVRVGDIRALEQIPITQVASIRLLNASDATQRFGTGHPVGAILVSSP